MKKLCSLIFTGWIVKALGLIAICVLIWLVGPLLAIADYRPLEGERTRAILIGLLVVGIAARWLWRTYDARRANGRLMESLLTRAPEPGAAKDDATNAEIATLRQRFEEAVAVLKKARLGERRWGPLSGLTQRWVYELPWYVFIGAPGSGKTTALINSGLQFPLRERLGQESIRGVGGTRDCDWWFTNDAVLIDTAGRYTTQESNQKADSAAWSGFLQLLKKYRARRPINGVLLTISVPDLLAQSAAQRDVHVDALRKRLQELHEQLNIRFPLYVLVTKMDMLAGFMEFFSDMGSEERAQIWGISFPYRGETPQEDVALKLSQELSQKLSQEFSLLEQRINARLIERLRQESDPQKRARIYLFPQQLAVLKGVLTQFIDNLFSTSPFIEKPLVRGVYFTSGTQEGSPIDKMMGSLGRALGLEPQLLAPNRPSGKSFFITRLLKDIVFQEAALAGTNLRWERRRKALQLAALTLAGLIAVSAMAAWTISYARNRAYVAQVQEHLQAASRQLAALDGGSDTSLIGLLPVLQTVRDLGMHANAPGDNVPLLMGLGLYQGEKLTAAADNAYRRLLHDLFLPRLTLRIEQQMRSSQRDNPELLYEALKAYLMLHEPQHMDATALAAYVSADWEGSLGRDVTSSQRKDLASHLAALLSGGDTLPSHRADASLIAGVRNAVAGTPLALRIYQRLKREGVGLDLPAFTVAGAGGPAAPLVFVRASGQPLTNGVPGLYSVDGYYKTFLQEAGRVATRLADEEGWVLGSQGSRVADPTARARLFGEVQRLYLEEYARTWEAFINDIKLMRAGSLQQSIQLARILSAPDSPLPLLLRAIVKQVTLMEIEEADKSVLDKAGDKVKSTREELLKLFGRSSNDVARAATMRPESIVDQRFQDVRRLVRSPGAGQPAPLDASIALINELYTMLSATEAALKGGNIAPPSDVPNKIKTEASHLPEPIRSMLLTLSASGTSEALGLTRSNLNAAMKMSLGDFCSKAINGRYPFVRSSTRDVTQEDFNRLFAPGGLIDDFFQKNLAQWVNTSTRPWRFRETMGDASGALPQFQRAQMIRDVFFHGVGAGAGMRLELKPLMMDASISQWIIDIDGQIVKYSHGPQVPTMVQWPGPRGTNQVRLQLNPLGAGAVAARTFEGPWALFRMFDQVQIESTGQAEKFIATFNFDGRKAQFEVRTSSVRNPFRLPELEQFRCPGQL
jgi:type VI secretion system protein ImpL